VKRSFQSIHGNISIHSLKWPSVILKKNIHEGENEGMEDVSMDGLKESSCLSPTQSIPHQNLLLTHPLRCPSLRRTHSYGNLPYN